VGGAGQVKITKDGKVLLDEMVRAVCFLHLRTLDKDEDA